MKDSQARKGEWEEREGRKREREGEREEREEKACIPRAEKKRHSSEASLVAYFFLLGPILSSMPTTSGQPIRLGCKPLEHGLEWCGGLNGNDPHRLTNFNTWSSGSGTIWKNWEVWPCQRKWVTGVDFEILQKANSKPKVILFLLPTDPNVELCYFSKIPWILLSFWWWYFFSCSRKSIRVQTVVQDGLAPPIPHFHCPSSWDYRQAPALCLATQNFL